MLAVACDDEFDPSEVDDLTQLTQELTQSDPV